MNDMLAEQIEALLGSYGSTHTLGRNLLGLSGFLGAAPFPENIAGQMERLSRLLLLQELFDKLVQALNHAARSSAAAPSAESGNAQIHGVDTSRILDQIEAVRRDMEALEPINYAELIAWLVAQAREQKILKPRARR